MGFNRGKQLLNRVTLENASKALLVPIEHQKPIKIHFTYPTFNLFSYDEFLVKKKKKKVVVLEGWTTRFENARLFSAT